MFWNVVVGMRKTMLFAQPGQQLVQVITVNYNYRQQTVKDYIYVQNLHIIATLKSFEHQQENKQRLIFKKKVKNVEQNSVENRETKKKETGKIRDEGDHQISSPRVLGLKGDKKKNKEKHSYSIKKLLK